MRLFVGGVRSGKSALAQQWVEAHSAGTPGCLLLLATCQVQDAGMAARVAAHQASRGPEWRVCEEPLDPLRGLESALSALGPEPRPGPRAVLLDCVSMWVANVQATGLDVPAIAERATRLAAGLRATGLPTALVTAEVGLGLVPMSEVGRQYIDMLGTANQILARACDTVVFVTCGQPLAVKGSL